MILYGKTINTIARDYFHGDLAFAEKLYTDFLNGMPKIRDWIKERHEEVASTGKTTLPYPFSHRMQIGKPSNEFSEEYRRSVNYPIQSSSSSFCAYQGYLTYKECRNQGINTYPYAFVHDSLILETDIAKLFQFLEIVTYYYVTWPYKTYGIPDGTDFEIGIGNFKKSAITYSIKDNQVLFDITFREFYNDMRLKDEFIKRLPNFKIIEETPVEKTILSTSKSYETKTSHNLCFDKPIKMYKCKCSCDFIPFSKPFLL